MDPSVARQSFNRKTMVKQLTGKRDDSPLHSAVRTGNLVMVKEILSENMEEDLKDALSKQNQSGETALYVASEFGYVDAVSEMIKHCDAASAGIKAKNGYDALHIAAKRGHIGILKVLLGAFPELSMTVDLSNTTALHTAATQGHTEVVNILLEADVNLAKIARSNGKTALHSAARNGHLEVLRALLGKESGIATRQDKKGQTALHMAVKGQNIEMVEELLRREPSLINLVDNKGNTALHIATRKCRAQTVKRLLELKATDTAVINRAGETALDTAEKTGHADVAALLLGFGAQSARSLLPPNPAKELKQTVSDIRHEVHSQLEHTYQTRKRVKGIGEGLTKLNAQGLNNAINSTTVVAVLIATVTFAAIFTVPGQYAGGQNEVPPGVRPGEANAARQAAFTVFFISDAGALFISLAVVVVQTSVVVVERKAKKRVMGVIGKLMWLACMMISMSFIAVAFIVVGRPETWLAVGVAVLGAAILATTLWAVAQQAEATRLTRSSPRSLSLSMSGLSESELVNGENKKMCSI